MLGLWRGQRELGPAESSSDHDLTLAAQEPVVGGVSEENIMFQSCLCIVLV